MPRGSDVVGEQRSQAGFAGAGPVVGDRNASERASARRRGEPRATRSRRYTTSRRCCAARASCIGPSGISCRSSGRARASCARRSSMRCRCLAQERTSASTGSIGSTALWQLLEAVGVGRRRAGRARRPRPRPRRRDRRHGRPGRAAGAGLGARAHRGQRGPRRPRGASPVGERSRPGDRAALRRGRARLRSAWPIRTSSVRSCRSWSARCTPRAARTWSCAPGASPTSATFTVEASRPAGRAPTGRSRCAGYPPSLRRCRPCGAWRGASARRSCWSGAARRPCAVPCPRSGKLPGHEPRRRIRSRVEPPSPTARCSPDPDHRYAVEGAMAALDRGELRVASPPESDGGEWTTHAWVKQAILLYFALRKMERIRSGPSSSTTRSRSRRSSTRRACASSRRASCATARSSSRGASSCRAT